MFFSEIRMARGKESAIARSFLDAYAAHKLVSRLCRGNSSESSAGSGDQRGRILFRLEWPGRGGPSGRAPWIVLLSPTAPSGDDRLDIRCKRYAPQLVPGNRLRFKLRANPIVSRRDATGRQSRHDVVMDLKRRLKAHSAADRRLPSQAELVHRAGKEWLIGRAEGAGFRVAETHLGSLAISNYAQHRFKRGRKSATAAKPTGLRMSTLDFEGVLEVADPERFGRVLCSGLGPAKGLGCGLLTVRRV